MSEKKLLIGITGASGAIYARSLLEFLASQGRYEVSVVASDAGQRVLREELGALTETGSGNFSQWLRVPPGQTEQLRWLPIGDIGAGPASGTYPLEAMAIVPCSMRTLAAVAHGLADNLLTRAADVCLKEGRRLVLAPPGDAPQRTASGKHAPPFPMGGQNSTALPSLLPPPAIHGRSGANRDTKGHPADGSGLSEPGRLGQRLKAAAFRAG